MHGKKKPRNPWKDRRRYGNGQGRRAEEEQEMAWRGDRQDGGERRHGRPPKDEEDEE